MGFDFLRSRKIQVDITVVFLTLFLGAFSIILWYTYVKNKEVVIEFSQELMGQLSKEAIKEIDSVLQTTMTAANIERSLITSEDDVSDSNKLLINFMLDALKSMPNLPTLHVGAPNGNFISLFTLITHERFYRNDPKKPLPKEYVYALLAEAPKDGKEKITTVKYLDINGNELEREIIQGNILDPKTRPWFIGAEETKRPFWTDPYIFKITKDLGITYSYPIYNNEGALIAIPGGDIQLRYISAYLSNNRISKNGQTIILTEDGLVIAAKDLMGRAITRFVNINELDSIFSIAYDQYKKSGDDSFVFDSNSTQHIASFTKYQAPSGKTWFIAVVVPVKDFLEGIQETQKKSYMIVLGILLISAILVTLSSRRISKPIVLLAKEVNRLKELDLESDLVIKSHVTEINVMSQAVYALRLALRSFGKYVPRAIVRQLLELGQEIQLGGTRKNLTIFFSDIYNFTPITESLPAEKVTELLAKYFDKLTRIILENKGTIDKYIGDGIMAFWGAPMSIDDPSFYACRSALLCQKELAALNKSFKESGAPLFETRMGLHSGAVIVGNIGTQERMEYTIIGDPVNLASRLEGTNKIYHTKILISDDVHQQIEGRFLTRPLDIVIVKGKKEPVKIYELLAQFNAPDMAPTSAQIELCQDFEIAFNHFHDKKGDAEILFQKIHLKFPDDLPTTLYLQRCKRS